MIYIAATCLLTLLGIAYVKIYDVVKAHQPEALPRFYLIMTVIRMILVASLAGIYILLSDNRQDVIQFVAIYMVMYAVMMVITLSMRH
jgi:cytochrome c biogenesis factor